MLYSVLLGSCWLIPNVGYFSFSYSGIHAPYDQATPGVQSEYCTEAVKVTNWCFRCSYAPLQRAKLTFLPVCFLI